MTAPAERPDTGMSNGPEPWPPMRELWLQHAGWDRRGPERLGEDLIATALAVPGTRVCDVAALDVLLADGGPAWRAPAAADHDALLLWLGGAQDGERLVRVHENVDERAGWTPWRSAAGTLSGEDAQALAVGLAVGRWHRVHRYCERCGTPTEVGAGGWLQRCPSCGGEHYPRTDPVVIMAVLDADERICLSRGHFFASKVGMSCPAGFVDAGESLEDAVRREVREELNLTVTGVTYAGSQPWPAAAQLMVAMIAHVSDPEGLKIDPTEVAAARWFTRGELRAALAAGEVTLPAPYAAGRWLVEGWLGERIPDDQSTIYTKAPH